MIATTHLCFSMWLQLAAKLGCTPTRDANTTDRRVAYIPCRESAGRDTQLLCLGFHTQRQWRCCRHDRLHRCDANETAHLLQPKNIEVCNLLSPMPAEAAILIEQALDPDGTVRDPVKSEHAGEWRNVRQSTPTNQL